MRVDALLRLANDVRQEYEPDTPEGALAREVLDMLGAAPPCGVDAFEVRDGFILIGDSNAMEVGGKMDSTAAREQAVLLLRAADRAERG